MIQCREQRRKVTKKVVFFKKREQIAPFDDKLCSLKRKEKAKLNRNKSESLFRNKFRLL